LHFQGRGAIVREIVEEKSRTGELPREECRIELSVLEAFCRKAV